MATHRLIPLTAIGSAAIAAQRVHPGASTAAGRLAPAALAAGGIPGRLAVTACE